VFDLTDGKFSKRDMSNANMPAPIQPTAHQNAKSQGPIITQAQETKTSSQPDDQKPKAPTVESVPEVKELKSKIQVVPPVDGKKAEMSEKPRFVLKKRKKDEQKSNQTPSIDEKEIE